MGSNNRSVVTSIKHHVISWSDVVKHVDKICNDIIRSDVEIDAILGLSRGGLVPAVMIANQLDIDEVYSYGLRSYSNKTGGDIKTYQLAGSETVKGDHILVVDDISDRGETLGYVKRQLCKPTHMPWTYKNIHTCTICVKPKTDFLPTWHAVDVEDDEWVIFPWESDACKPKDRM